MSLAIQKKHKNIFKGSSLGVWGVTLASLVMVGFLGLVIAPGKSDEAGALTQNSEMAVGVTEVLSLRIVEQNESTGEWDVDTDTVSTEATHGSFASASVRVLASTNGAGGYQLTLNDVDSNTALRSSVVENTIPALASNVTIDNITDTTEKFTAGKWGYSVAKNTETASLTFKPMPASSAAAADKLLDNTSELGANYYTFTLGVRVEETTPAETYEDQVMFSLIGNVSPSAPAFFNTTYMQNFDATTCNTVKAPQASTTAVTADNGGDYTYSGGYATKVPSTTIKDRRDEQVYTIRKLADGNCWMTSNLMLGKLGAVALDSTNSNLMSGRTFNLPAATTTAGTSWGNQDLKPFVFYRDGNPNSTSPSGIVANSPSGLYNWYTATAGARSSTDSTDGALMTATGGQASDSVCPKNWQLPVNGGTSTDRSYGKLVYLYTGATGNSSATDGTEQGEINETRIEQLIQAPTSFVSSDYYYYGGTLYSRPIGYYWSSSVSSATHSYDLYFPTSGTTRSLNPQSGNDKGNAFAVRCVVAPAS